MPYNAFDYKDYRELFDDPDGDPRFEITVAQSSEFGWSVSRLNTSMYAFADSVCMLQQGDQDGSNEPGGEFMTRFFFDKTALTDLLKEYIRGVYPLLRRFSAEALTTPRERNIPWSASVYQGGEKLTYSFINLGGRLQASPMDDNINTLQEYNGQYGLYIMLLNAYMLDAINPNVRKGYNTDGRLGLNATDGIIEESRPFFAVEFGDSGHYAEVLLDGTVYPKRK